MNHEGASCRLGRTCSEEGMGSFQQGHFQRSLEINVGRDICLNRDGIIVRERKSGTLHSS